MGNRAKLVAFLLGTMAAALPLAVLVAMPAPQPPDPVERIDLQAPRGGDEHADVRTDAPAAGRKRHRSRRGDRRPTVTTRRAGVRKGAPTPTSISTGEAGAQVGRAPLDPAPATDAPTPAPRGESAPGGGGPSTPRSTPVSGTPPAPGGSPPGGDPPSEPPDQPDPPDEPATSAAVDPPEDPEPTDADPTEGPEPIDGEPPT
jgi:hypothetical protein